MFTFSKLAEDLRLFEFFGWCLVSRVFFSAKNDRISFITKGSCQFVFKFVYIKALLAALGILLEQRISSAAAVHWWSRLSGGVFGAVRFGCLVVVVVVVVWLLGGIGRWLAVAVTVV